MSISRSDISNVIVNTPWSASQPTQPSSPLHLSPFSLTPTSTSHPHLSPFSLTCTSTSQAHRCESRSGDPDSERDACCPAGRHRAPRHRGEDHPGHEQHQSEGRERHRQGGEEDLDQCAQRLQRGRSRGTEKPFLRPWTSIPRFLDITTRHHHRVVAWLSAFIF